MQTFFVTLLKTLASILGAWAAKLAGKEFLEWAMLWAAEKYVESTETKADDIWLAKIKETIREGK